MTESLDHKTFDLVSVLAGRTYPTLDIPVYFNEDLGFRIYQLEKKRREALLLDSEDAKDLDKEFQELSKSTESEKYTVTLKGIPEHIRRDVTTTVQAQFPSKKNFMGQEDVSPEADTLFTKKMWAVYIQAITDPEGAVTTADEKTIDAIYDHAPAGVHKALNVGIGELQGGAEAGFEQAAKEINFLSDASPEG